MPALSSIIAGVAAAAAVGGTSYAVVAGEEGKRIQADALGKQERAQKEAANAAASKQRQSEMAQNAANRKKPDVAGILSAAGAASGGGVGGTMLTGAGGVDPNSLSLGKASLLGG